MITSSTKKNKICYEKIRNNVPWAFALKPAVRCGKDFHARLPGKLNYSASVSCYYRKWAGGSRPAPLSLTGELSVYGVEHRMLGIQISRLEKNFLS